MTKSEELIKGFIYAHLDDLADIIKEVVKEHRETNVPVKGDIFKLRGDDYMVVDVGGHIKGENSGVSEYDLYIGAARINKDGAVCHSDHIGDIAMGTLGKISFKYKAEEGDYK